MSLKAVHLLFVITFSLLSFGCGFWKLAAYRSEIGTSGDLMLGLGGLGVGVLVVVYGRYFLNKLKAFSYL
jgi:hypothetical protein